VSLAVVHQLVDDEVKNLEMFSTFEAAAARVMFVNEGEKVSVTNSSGVAHIDDLMTEEGGLRVLAK
jgi:hypothetical protein